MPKTIETPKKPIPIKKGLEKVIREVEKSRKQLEQIIQKQTPALYLIKGNKMSMITRSKATFRLDRVLFF